MKIILITGVPRSGTSLTAGIVHHCGAFGGKLSPPNPSNKKGMFENTYIRTHIVKSYLRNAGLDPLGQSPLPHPKQFVQGGRHSDFLRGGRLRNFFVQHMISQDWDKTAPLFYKGPKMCLMWPAWVSAFPEAQWVLVHRDKEQIIDSCIRTPFMKRHGKNRKGWGDFVDTYRAHMEELAAAAPGRSYMIWSADILEDLNEARKLIDWLELEWNEEAVRGFVEPSLYNRVRGQKNNNLRSNNPT